MPFCRAWGEAVIARRFPDSSIEDVTSAVLVLSELVANAMKASGEHRQEHPELTLPVTIHGNKPYGESLVVLGQLAGAFLVIKAYDDAPGAPQTDIPDAPDDAESGRGLHIAHALSDRLGYSEYKRGGCAWAIIRLSQEQPLISGAA